MIGQGFEGWGDFLVIAIVVLLGAAQAIGNWIIKQVKAKREAEAAQGAPAQGAPDQPRRPQVPQVRAPQRGGTRVQPPVPPAAPQPPLAKPPQPGVTGAGQPVARRRPVAKPVGERRSLVLPPVPAGEAYAPLSEHHIDVSDDVEHPHTEQRLDVSDDVEHPMDHSGLSISEEILHPPTELGYTDDGSAQPLMTVETSRHALRKAIILREILSPPLALRE